MVVNNMIALIVKKKVSTESYFKFNNGDIEMVANNEKKTRECPYCKEEILADAIKCKHCASSVAAEAPSHKGICPYCKEQINPEAIKCKHCKSAVGQKSPFLQEATGSGCGCGDFEEQAKTLMPGNLEQFNMNEAAATPDVPLAQQQLGFAGFSTKCFYYGSFLGWWCCLYLRGRLISCVNRNSPLLTH